MAVTVVMAGQVVLRLMASQAMAATQALAAMAGTEVVVRMEPTRVTLAAMALPEATVVLAVWAARPVARAQALVLTVVAVTAATAAGVALA